MSIPHILEKEYREVLDRRVINRGLQEERSLHCYWSRVLAFWVEDEVQNLKHFCLECATSSTL